jgi:hypothetical protein
MQLRTGVQTVGGCANRERVTRRGKAPRACGSSGQEQAQA